MSSNPYPWTTREQNNIPLAQSSVSLHEQFHLPSTSGTKHDEYSRQLNRTPSPTPSELRELGTGAIEWKRVMSWRFWFRKEWACSSLTLFLRIATDEEHIVYYVISVVLIVLVALMTVYHVQIVHWLTPVATWLRDK